MMDLGLFDRGSKVWFIQGGWDPWFIHRRMFPVFRGDPPIMIQAAMLTFLLKRDCFFIGVIFFFGFKGS